MTVAPVRSLASGNSRASPRQSLQLGARLASVTPGSSRPMPCRKTLLRSSGPAASNRSGIQSATSRRGKSKPRGITPTTTYGVPSSATSCPGCRGGRRRRLPEAVAQHHRRRRRRGLVAGESARPDGRADAERLEQVGGRGDTSTRNRPGADHRVDRGSCTPPSTRRSCLRRQSSKLAGDSSIRE